MKPSKKLDNFELIEVLHKVSERTNEDLRFLMMIAETDKFPPHMCLKFRKIAEHYTLVDDIMRSFGEHIMEQDDRVQSILEKIPPRG